MLLSVSLCGRQTWKDFPFLRTPWIISGLSEGVIQFKATADLIVTFHTDHCGVEREPAHPRYVLQTQHRDHCNRLHVCVRPWSLWLEDFSSLCLSWAKTTVRDSSHPHVDCSPRWPLQTGSASASPQVISLLSPEWEYVAHTVFFLLYVLIYKYLNTLHPFVAAVSVWSFLQVFVVFWSFFIWS